MNLEQQIYEILVNLVEPIVGKRCPTTDKEEKLHDEVLTEDNRCLVCKTYEQVEEAKTKLIDLMVGARRKLIEDIEAEYDRQYQEIADKQGMSQETPYTAFHRIMDAQLNTHDKEQTVINPKYRGPISREEVSKFRDYDER